MSKQGNMILVLVSAVAAIALIAAGYFFYQNQQLQKNKEVVSTLNAGITTTSPVNQPEVEKTNWKSYTYSPWHLSFNYPDGWYVYPDQSSQNIRIQSYSQLEKGGGNPKGLYLLTVRILPIKAINIGNLISLLPKSGDVVPYLGDSRTITISNENSDPLNTYPLYTRTITYKSETDSASETFNYFLDQKGNVLEISAGLDVTGGKNITDQILSTFKFLPQNEQNQTFHWQGLGVSFYYPNSWSPSKPVSTIQTPQSGGHYQQSFSSGSNINANLSLGPKDLFAFPNQISAVIGGKNGIKAEYSSPMGSNVYQFTAIAPFDDQTNMIFQIFVQPSDPQSIILARQEFGEILATLKFL